MQVSGKIRVTLTLYSQPRYYTTPTTCGISISRAEKRAVLFGPQSIDNVNWLRSALVSDPVMANAAL